MTLDGKIALITGGARGQGRAHAVTLARAGADVVVCDIAAPVDEVDYPLATPADLRETAELVESIGRRCVKLTADVRDFEDMQRVTAAAQELGGLDIVVANAGIASGAPIAEMSEMRWRTMLDINLTGVFNTFRAALPMLVERGAGHLVATSSIVAKTGAANSAHYAASKAGVVALVQSLAHEVAEHGIAVNAGEPGTRRRGRDIRPRPPASGPAGTRRRGQRCARAGDRSGALPVGGVADAGQRAVLAGQTRWCPR